MKTRFRFWLIAAVWLAGAGGIWWWGLTAVSGSRGPDGTAVLAFVPGTHVAVTTRPADAQAGIAYGPFERWNLDTGTCVDRDPGPAERSVKVDSTDDGRIMLLSVGSRNRPSSDWALFDLARWRVVGRLSGPRPPNILKVVACGGPDARLCAVTAADQAGRAETAVFDIETGERVRTLPGYLTSAGRGRFVTTTRPLPTTGKPGAAATVWDATDGRAVGQVTHSDTAEVWGTEWPAALTADGRTLVDRHGGVFDTTTGARIAQLPHGLYGPPVLTADGELIGLYLDGDHVRVRWFDLATAAEQVTRSVRLPIGNGGFVGCGAVPADPDGRRAVVSVSTRRPMALWAVWLGAIHPSLARLGAGGDVERSYLLDAATGEVLLSATGYLTALSDDGRLAAVGGLNGRVVELPQRLPWATMLGLLAGWTLLAVLAARRFGRRPPRQPDRPLIASSESQA